MTWVYRQSNGELDNPDGKFVAQGYAGGNCGLNPEGRNNHEYESVLNVGPLPCGRYKIGKPINHPKLGPLALPLTPDPANEMYGRSAFLMHGDLIDGPPGSASDGCIIMPRNVREYVATSGDDDLQVVSGVGAPSEETE